MLENIFRLDFNTVNLATDNTAANEGDYQQSQTTTCFSRFWIYLNLRLMLSLCVSSLQVAVVLEGTLS